MTADADQQVQPGTGRAGAPAGGERHAHRGGLPQAPGDGADIFQWRKKFGELGTPENRELRQLREANGKLKQLVANLSLDKTILQDSLRKKW